MNRNNILELENPSKDVTIPDTLTDFLRESAQKMAENIAIIFAKES